MKIFSIILISIFSCLSLHSQSIDEELGFIYVKADYLLETDRYEDAIKEFTKIIAKDPKYKDALYKRAKAKYAIAAFKGTKKDLLQAFELVGITPESLELFGKAQKNLDEHDASETTLKTSSMISTGGRTSTSTTSNKRKDNDTSTEQDDEDKGALGSLEDQLSSILEDLLPDRKTDEEGTTTDTGKEGSTTTTGSDSNDSDTDTEVEVKKEPEVDNSVNEILIDEDLTLEIKDGLGGRKILQQPNILILSDKSGEVSVDVCVNANGKVTSAEYNKGNSSISTQSLVSLAVRKSKEFWFKKADAEETCGTIVFKITGGS